MFFHFSNICYGCDEPHADNEFTCANYFFYNFGDYITKVSKLSCRANQNA